MAKRITPVEINDLINEALSEDLENGIYSEKEKQRVYDKVSAIAQKLFNENGVLKESSVDLHTRKIILNDPLVDLPYIFLLPYLYKGIQKHDGEPFVIEDSFDITVCGVLFTDMFLENNGYVGYNCKVCHNKFLGMYHYESNKFLSAD